MGTWPLFSPMLLYCQRIVWVKSYPIPLYECPVSAGFPSPAEDYIEGLIDLNEHLIQNPSDTYLVRVSGTSMVGAGILHGDILIVDRSLQPKDKSIVIACIDGENTVKRYCKRGRQVYLEPENDEYQSIQLTEDQEIRIWGVVVHAIHTV